MADSQGKGFFGRAYSAAKYAFTGRTDYFGPGEPVQAIITDEQAVASGAKGRQFDFPVATNMQISPRAAESVTFSQLRALADNLDVLRLAIETRKDQVAKLQWKIVAKEGENVSDSRLKELNNFFRRPDRVNKWGPWLRMLLEDMFVIDAMTIYPRRTNGGKLYSLEPMDGATIKRVIDDGGRTPESPDPAYQQVIKGSVAANYTRDELIYRPRNQRTHKIYGYPPVEQIILTVNVAIRRALHQLQFYTEGNVPEAVCGVPESWSVDQISQFQSYWDSLLEGNTAARRHMKFIPGGLKPYFTKEAVLKDEMDEWLARVVCFCFSLPPTALVKQMNRATAEQQEETAAQEGLLPLMDFTKEFVDDALEIHMDAGDCELSWEQEKSIDPKTQAEIDQIYVTIQVQTPEQIAKARGFEWIEPPPKSEPVAPIVPGADPGAVPNTDNGAAQLDGNPALVEESMPAEPLAKADKKKTRKLAPILFEDNPAAQEGLKKVSKIIADFLKEKGSEIAEQLSGLAALEKAEKKKPKTVDEAIDELDFGDWKALFGPVSDELIKTYEEAGYQALAQLGVTEEGITELVHEQAVEFARERAAEMVGMKWVDGELIENPNAEWAITDSTRTMLRELVTGSLEKGPSTQELAKEIEESAAFSESRAEMVARTELADMHSAGTLDGYKEASAAGIVVMKEWLVGDGDSCEICQANADVGPIPLDEDFPSGDDKPTAHPRCECSLVPVVITEEDVDTGEEPYK